MRNQVRLWILAACLVLAPEGAGATVFTNWSSVDATSNVAVGTLGTAVITVRGVDVQGGVTNGTGADFNFSSFCPQIAAGDALHLGFHSTASTCSVSFSQPVQDPILHIRSLAGTLTFHGVTVTKLCGQPSFTVSGSTVQGVFLDGPTPNDASGTIRVNGLVSAVTFAGQFTGVAPVDGIHFQIGSDVEPTVADSKTVLYDAGTGLTPPESCPPWIPFIEGTGGTTSMTDGTFRISNGVQSASLAYFVPVKLADPMVVEFRGRRPSGTTSHVARTHMGIIIGKGSSVGVHLFIGDDLIFLTGGFNIRGPQASRDTDAFHDYRIEVSGSVVRVYYDGALTLTGSTYASSEFGGQVIQWGDFSNFADGVSEWQYVRHNSSAIECPDTTPPLVTAPADTLYHCISEVPEAAPEQATATDDRGIDSFFVTSTSNGGAGSPASPHIVTRIWTATDESGNTGSDSQTITVIDDTPPSIEAPASLERTAGPGVELCADLRLEVTAPGTVSSDDNCGSVTALVNGVPAGNLYPVGATTLFYTASDAVGNTTTATQTVTVRCPVGALAGSVTRSCNGATVPAEGVTVRLLHEGTSFREVLTVADGSYFIESVRLGTYTVQVVPPEDYAEPIDTRVVTLTEENGAVPVGPFALTCRLGDIAGVIEGTCNGNTSALHGVTVDLFREGSEGMEVLVGSVSSDASGAFRFDDLALGEYTATPVVPLGYSAGTSSIDVTLTQPDGTVAAGPFALTCQSVTAEPRGMGYWKHQVNVYLTGKGHADLTLDQLLGFLLLLTDHFNENVVNPVIVYVPGSTSTTDKLLHVQQLLAVNKGGTTLDRAKRELLALLLNVVSGKISQTHVISVDGATVSQAITYCDNLMDASSGDHARAQSIAEYVNSGAPVPAGMIPLTTAQIAYRREQALRSFRVTPNPGSGARSFQFSIGEAGPVKLSIYDVSGRLVTALLSGDLPVGPHVVAWAGVSTTGARLGHGLYFARLEIPGGAKTLKVIHAAR